MAMDPLTFASQQLGAQCGQRRAGNSAAQHRLRGYLWLPSWWASTDAHFQSIHPRGLQATARAAHGMDAEPPCGREEESLLLFRDQSSRCALATRHRHRRQRAEAQRRRVCHFSSIPPARLSVCVSLFCLPACDVCPFSVGSGQGACRGPVVQQAGSAGSAGFGLRPSIGLSPLTLDVTTPSALLLLGSWRPEQGLAL
jgi:hypothetical protein